jgi:sugar transferase (PEP-CTERM system associated)
MRILNQRFILFVGDLLLVALAYGVASLPAAGSPLDLSGTGSMQLAAILLLYSSAFFVFDLYNTARSFRSAQTVVRLVVAVTLAGVFSVLLFYLVPRWHLSPTHLGIQNTVVALLVMAWRLIFGKLFQVKTKKVGALVLGAGETGLAIYRLLTAPFSPYEVKGFLDDDPAKVGRVVGSPAVVGTLDQLGEVAAQMGLRTAILALPRNRPFHLTRKILEARLHGMEILEMPAVYEKITGRMPVQHIEDQWLLFSEGFSLLSKEYVRKLKRIMDILVSGFLLIVTAPVMALTALAIRLESAGPIFYHQDRVGEGGDPFTLLKFRSMRRDAEEQGPKWAQKRDPRITRVGRLIRPFHIDELPQIWNVFKGDMSLVGPRPERPEFVRELEQRIPYYCVRHAVPPGITGWAQVNYPYGASEEDAMRKLEYDLYYLKNMSLLLDLKILLRTIGVVLMSEGSR